MFSVQRELNTFREVKQPGREANHSPPSFDDVQYEWSYTSLPPYAFMP